MRKPVLVTGATGFIGAHVVRALLRRGESVRVFVRRPALLPPALRHLLEIRQGDLCDARALREAVAGCGSVLHLAACARAWCRDAREFEAVNVGAVRTLVDFVRDCGVERLVHVSTVLTLPRPAATRARTHYEATKLDGEQMVAECPVAVVVHPTRVYGPGPLNDANGVTRVIAAYLAGWFRFRLDDDDVEANYVHVADVAGGILLAARCGVPGAHYVLGGENASMRGLLDTAARVSGVHHHIATIPPACAVAFAAAAEAWGRIGGSVPITRDWVRLFLEDQRIEKPATPAGYAPRGLESGLSETIEWLRRQGRRAA